MGQVIGMRPTPPVDPIKCDCTGTTFFVYWDGHIICKSCGRKPEYLGPLVDWENPKDPDDGESAIVFEADPSLLDKLE